MGKYVFGIDLGGTTIKVGLFTLSGALAERRELPSRTENAGKGILSDIAAMMKESLASRRIDSAQICSVGLGVPGAVREARIVAPCVNLDGWGGFDVAQALSALCGSPVTVLNDADAAVLGEHWHGAGKGCRNMMLVTLGTGVGGGLILGGSLVEGAHGAAGEIGHIKVFPEETERCGCGGFGCLEQYASARGIVRLAERGLENCDEPSVLRGCTPLSAKAVLDAAKNGDAVALNVAERMGAALGTALAAVSCVCDPELYLLGGGVSAAGDILLRLLRPTFERNVFPLARPARFALAKLGNDAGMYGAALQALRAAGYTVE